jgi:tetratricopeptide (TPR) repeat protein
LHANRPSGQRTRFVPDQPATAAPRFPRLFSALALLALASVSLCGCSVAAHGQNAQGVSLYQQGRYQEAVQSFERAIANDPHNADGYYNLAATYHKMGLVSRNENELKQAEEQYNLCLDKDDNHRDCYRGLAVLLSGEGRSDEAFRLLDGWSHKYPSQATPKIELARLSEETGNYEMAKNHLLDALQSDPHDARALAALARLRERSGNPGQALAVYQRSLWNNPNQPEVAARISSLQTALNPPSFTSPPPSTQMVNTNPAVPRRY